MNKKKEKKIIKQDINFLNNPLWSIDPRDKRNEFKIETYKGVYTYKSAYDEIPDSTDMLFLYSWLRKAQNSESNCIEFTKYQILKDCRKSASKRNYERLSKSLKKWVQVSILFDGCLLVLESGATKSIDKGFHILTYEDVQEKTEKGRTKGKVKININENFIQFIEDSGIQLDIDLNTFIDLETPLARRLFEWLPKQFYRFDEYIIECNLFFDYIRMKPAKQNSIIERKLEYISDALIKVSYFSDYVYSVKLIERKNKKHFFFKRKNKIIFVEDVNLNNDEISKKLEEYGFTDIKEVREKYTNSTLLNAFNELNFEINKRKSEGVKEIDNKGGWIRRRLPKDGGKYVFSKAYIDNLKQQEAIENRNKKIEDRKQEEIEEKKANKYRFYKKEKAKDYFLKQPDNLKKKILGIFQNYLKEDKTSFERKRFNEKLKKGKCPTENTTFLNWYLDKNESKLRIISFEEWKEKDRS